MFDPVDEVLVGELADAWVLLETFHPNIYYRWDESGAVDEGGGGLNAYGLTLYRLFDGTYVPEGVIDDGGYDAWGSGQPERLVFKPRPAHLEGELFLPPVLHAGMGNVLLLHRSMAEGLPVDPARVTDAYGTPREGYVVYSAPEMPLEDVRSASLPIVSVTMGLRPRLLVRRALAAAWEARDPLLTFLPLTRHEHFAMPSCYATLPQWQSGRPKVLVTR